jgi:hypothetical protein
MCGRFALYSEPVKVARFLQATPEGVKDDWQPSWNIPPTERIVGARERVDDNGEITRTLGLYRWGLVPFWAKDPSVGNRAFNARAETVATKPMFRHAFTTGKRILIPADAFYEWKKTGGLNPRLISCASPTCVFSLANVLNSPRIPRLFTAAWRSHPRTESENRETQTEPNLGPHRHRSILRSGNLRDCHPRHELPSFCCSDSRLCWNKLHRHFLDGRIGSELDGTHRRDC